MSTNEELHAESSQAEELVKHFTIETAMKGDIFKLVAAVLVNNEELDPESRRLLEKELKGYVRKGLGLPTGHKRERFKEIKKRLARSIFNSGRI